MGSRAMWTHAILRFSYSKTLQMLRRPRALNGPLDIRFMIALTDMEQTRPSGLTDG